MKIWSKLFLVLATGMMMFSSCLENIEPEGIKDLRGAKAELLRAKTALEEANAAKVNAEAAFVQAQAKIQEAIAKQEEAKAAYEAAVARLKELEVEKQTALDQIEIEKAIAEAQAAIVEAEALAAVYAAELERDLLDVQAEIAASQAALEVALKNLAIAKNTLTQEQQDAIASLESAVITARDEVEAKTVALENAAKQLAAALAEVDEVKANKLNMRMAELKLVKAQAALEAAKEAEAEAKAALELDPSVTDWEAKAEEYEAEIEKIRSEYYKRNGEIEDSMATMRDSVDYVITPMAEDYTAYTGYFFNTTTGFFSKYYDKNLKTESYEIPEIYVDVPEYSDFEVPTSYRYDEEEDMFEKFDNEISSVNVIETYLIPYFERYKEAYSELVDAMPEADKYVEAVEYYEDLVAAYQTGDYVAFANKNIFTDESAEYEVGPVEDAVKNYNDALASFEEAFDTYVDLLATVTPDQLVREKIEADYFKAIDDAETARYKARNEALNKKNTAEATYIAAKYADIVKIQARDLAIENALYVAGFNVVEEDYVPGEACAWATAVAVAKTTMAAVVKPTAPTAPTAPTDKTAPNYDTLLEAYNTALEIYNTITKPEYDAALALYNKYQTAIEAITKAEKGYDDPDPKVETDPASVWAKAKEAWATAQGTYDTAIADAEKAYAQAVRDAEIAKKNATAQYKESIPEIDGEYKTYLKEILDDEWPALKTAIAKLEGVVGQISFGGQYDYVSFMYNTGDMGILFKAPEYLVSEDKKFVPVDVEAIVALIDPETVLEAITDYYDQYIFTSDLAVTYVNVAQIICEDYPLSYPTYEEFVAYEEATGETLELKGYVGAYYNALAGVDVLDELLEEFEIDSETNKAYVAALEDAKEQVEAIVAENAEKLAADKAEVEAFYAKYLAAEEKNEEELEAIKIKAYVLIGRYNAMIEVIASYCRENGNLSTQDVDALVARLQDLYEDAVKDVIFAEEDVYNAEQAIEDVKAGIVTAADAAQRAYDRAAEELAVAISKLEKVTAALENIIAAIYETGEVPETPETPETPEGGDDTTEGGEETPAE